MSHRQARRLADSWGLKFYWSKEDARTPEGYFRIHGGIEYSIARAIAFAPYSDLLWMETKKPGLEYARHFARSVRAVHPNQLFAYNHSPSFNWDASGMSDREIASFQQDLAQDGYVWQFITLAGFHDNALAITEFARAYAHQGMLAYVEMVQRRERELQVETLTHQKWSGAELVDTQIATITGGLSSTTSMQDGNTEAQFAEPRASLAAQEQQPRVQLPAVPRRVKRPTEEEFDQVLE